MPRKNSRPAEKKIRAKKRAAMVRKAAYGRAMCPYRREPHLGDSIMITALAASLLNRRRARGQFIEPRRDEEG